jgi:hypothetical protein
MSDRNITNNDAPQDGRAATAGSLEPTDAPLGRGWTRSRGWLFGAYTFLFVWGLAFLVLFFTDRLPV